jgi:glycyl-tRNA synthetase beta chain
VRGRPLFIVIMVSSPASKDLLLEIGTEEIPSSFLPGAISDLASRARELLSEARLDFQEIRSNGTPRRLLLHVRGLAGVQRPSRRQVVGPSARVAFDAEGRPTAAALGFARSQGVPLESLVVKPLEKGEYLIASIEEPGLPAAEVLSSLLPRIITSLPLPKSMRWGEGNLRFLRPIRWILALFGEQVVAFEMDGIQSGNLTYGHRFLSPKPVRVRSFRDYQAKLRRKFVIVDRQVRRQMIQEAAEQEASRVGGQVEWDPELLHTVTDLVEYPVALWGRFDEEYLQLPREVITTPMKKQQRYFPVVDESGKLLPYFIAISNLKPKDETLIRQGNERVLAARLADARFFFQEDRKAPLASRIPQLSHILYQEHLGTLCEKTERISYLCGFLADRLCPEERDLALRAARLAKADLLTLMVKEFPDLQGTMGRIYAKLEGEDERVAQAIEEHYLPRFAGDGLPRTLLGALVSLADKMDSICACFALGIIPTGSEDPYALRRQGTGLILTVLEQGLRLSLSAFVDQALGQVQAHLSRFSPSLAFSEAKEKVRAFLGQRLEGVLADRGFAPDLIEAVLAAGFDDMVAAQGRVEALAALRQRHDFENLAIAFRRLKNILPPSFSGSVRPQLFQEEAERRLWEETEKLREMVGSYLCREDYLTALEAISSLRPAVDRFFEEVLVMVKEGEIRENRLSLVAAVLRLLDGLADLSRLAAEVRRAEASMGKVTASGS